MFNDEKRRKIEQDRKLEHLIQQAIKIDSDVMLRLWKIFDYDTGREVYRMYETFLTIYTKEDAEESAIMYGLRYL